MMNQTHRIPLVVFVEVVEAIDQHESATIAEIAVRQAMSGEQRPATLPATMPAQLRDATVPVTVTAIKDLDTAALNGYLRFHPSDRAYPHQEGDQ